ncbi:MAG: GTP cyclohydrolase II RibA [Actinomycetota bacterium]|nr:GTP cyclohydrolase II RibA [Actinomycetota bacterium]
MTSPRLVARVMMPTAFGEFIAHAYECRSGFVYLALVRGEIGDGREVLVRVHSECLTGDALGSRRCECGVQLATSLRQIAAEGRGVLIYATGHEGRGIGLAAKLLAYAEQERGLDTVDANVRLGHPVDGRRYDEAAAVLSALGVVSIHLLTNNPLKVKGLRRAGIEVDRVEPLLTAPHARNVEYLRAKRQRMGHLRAAGPPPPERTAPPPDVASLMGPSVDPTWRPRVILKYAQTVDGRIATASGDARWISGAAERELSHALRAACDAVMVGVGTVVSDDPQLTVRLVPGASPVRVVLDSSLRIPLEAAVLQPDAGTIVLTTAAASTERRAALRDAGAAVEIVVPAPAGVDLAEALRALRGRGIRTLLVEGGSRLITSLLAADVVDRVIVGIAPTILGAGTDAVGDLGVSRIAEGVRLANTAVYVAGDDVILAGDVDRAAVPTEQVADGTMSTKPAGA